MSVTASRFKNVLVGMDFSVSADAALKQAFWLAQKSTAKLVLVHALRDLRQAMHRASYDSRLDFFYGEGLKFQREIRRESDAKMREIVAPFASAGLDVKCETLLGDPFVALIHAAQAECSDLVIVGTRGLSTWQQLLMGSTAKKLIRKCPTSVWTVTANHVESPKIVLAATDFSEVSRKAVLHGLEIADLAEAKFHLLHVIDSADVPEDLLQHPTQGTSFRQEVNQVAKEHLESFINSLGVASGRIQPHLTYGTPWQEINRLSDHLNADLISIGTIGHSGIQEMLLGTTAERVLDVCHSSILTVKPDGFVSPIEPASWPPLTPPQE